MLLRAMPLFVILSTNATIADTSELWLEWQGLDTDAREVSLAPGQSAVVEIYFRMRSDERLYFMGWRNEPAPHLEQIDTTAELFLWADHSTPGILGGPSQEVGFETPTDLYVHGPGTFLVGTQTIRLNGVGDGNPMEIALDVDTLQVSPDWLVLATGDPFLNETYTFHLGAGSPGYVDGLNYADERDPLIVIPIPEPSSLLLLGLGMATGMVIMRRRLKR